MYNFVTVSGTGICTMSKLTYISYVESVGVGSSAKFRQVAQEPFSETVV
jgi:hypothetical protein